MRVDIRLRPPAGITNLPPAQARHGCYARTSRREQDTLSSKSQRSAVSDPGSRVVISASNDDGGRVEVSQSR